MVRSKADEQARDEGCTFVQEKADRVRKFFHTFLRHSKGQWAGQAFELLDWQWEGIVAPLFGWVRPDGTRRFRRAGIWVPKKNGKSALCSGLTLYMLLGDREPGAEVYSAAADRDQASIVYNEAANMVDASPALSSKLTLVRSTKRILHQASASVFRALSAEAPTKEGLNWSCLIFDELHAQKGRELWDTLAYGGRARRQPLLISISTAGYDRDTIGYEQYLYAKGVLEGTIQDTSFLAYVAEADADDDWTAPDVWEKSNPSLGITVTRDAFEQECREAKNSPAKENVFRRYLLNQWTEQDVRWLSLEQWDACGIQVKQESLTGRPCYVGLDLASVKDTTAAVFLFPDQDGGYDVLPFFWVPEDACRRRERSNGVRFDAWMKAGHMEVTPGPRTDYDVIRARFNELREKYDIREIAIDRWNATQLAKQLSDDGFEVILFGQGMASMTAPTKEFEALVLAGKLRHGGHPVLRWMAGNVSVEQDAAGNLKPNKAKSGEKIDGIVAGIMALGRAMLREPDPIGCVEAWG